MHVWQLVMNTGSAFGLMVVQITLSLSCSSSPYIFVTSYCICNSYVCTANTSRLHSARAASRFQQTRCYQVSHEEESPRGTIKGGKRSIFTPLQDVRNRGGAGATGFAAQVGVLPAEKK